jgi:hypothetical protein
MLRFTAPMLVNSNFGVHRETLLVEAPGFIFACHVRSSTLNTACDIKAAASLKQQGASNARAEQKAGAAASHGSRQDWWLLT